MVYNGGKLCKDFSEAGCTAYENNNYFIPATVAACFFIVLRAYFLKLDTKIKEVKK